MHKLHLKWYVQYCVCVGVDFRMLRFGEDAYFARKRGVPFSLHAHYTLTTLSLLSASLGLTRWSDIIPVQNFSTYYMLPIHYTRLTTRGSLTTHPPSLHAHTTRTAKMGASGKNRISTIHYTLAPPYMRPTRPHSRWNAPHYTLVSLHATLHTPYTSKFTTHSLHTPYTFAFHYTRALTTCGGKSAVTCKILIENNINNIFKTI